MELRLPARVPLALRHRLERLRARLRGEPALIVHGAAYQLEFPGVPIDGLRGERILTALVREGLIGRDAVIPPARATLAKLERVHDSAYLERVTEPATIEAVFGVALPPKLIEQLVTLQRTMVGGTLQAARAAHRRHQLAVNLAGGLHHAHRERGEGFCMFNDIAVAIAELRANGFVDPIAVIDLDVHDGDGTRALFAADPSVYTLSIHNAHWGPTDAIASRAIALGDRVGDREYLAALREHVGEVLDRQRPSLVFYLAGADPAGDDPLGNWDISAQGMLERDTLVLDALRLRGIRKVVWLLGGGYGSEAWRHAARGLIVALGGPRAPELPSTQSITLARYHHLREVLDPRELSGVAPGELHFDESDLYGAAAQQGPATKILGFYTPHGVEVALERYGLLPRLRALGYEPRLECDHHGDTGDTLRVFGGPDDEVLLIELRVSRDATTLTGVELLRIEWLLLQNPRASWTGGRFPLPGQRHPGLRMFDDVAALMVMVCHRLRLDGIVVVPSHYHVAARWHGRMHFIDPRAEGRFLALQQQLAGLSLVEASSALERRSVIDVERDEPVVYAPAPMVLAVSDALARRFDAAWSREVELERARVQLSGPRGTAAR